MRKLFFGRMTLLCFVIISAFFFIVPAVLNVGRVGYSSSGFPFTYYEFSSAPPPMYGSKSDVVPLIGDVLIYYALSIVVAYTIRRLKK
jgi:hypothetical protein